MIVPQNRMLFWAGLILPCAGLAGLFAPAILPAVALVFVFGAIAALDAFSATERLAGLAIRTPDVVRMSSDQDGEISIEVENVPQGARSIRIGLPFPKEIESADEDMRLTLPEGSRFSRVQWKCVARKRGKYSIDRIYVEVDSPMRLWGYRRSLPIQLEIRVYPDLTEERKKVASMFVSRENYGARVQRVVGQGREFEKLREYIPGDSFDQVHWKATAKRGKPVTKVFQIERTQEVYVIIDSSRLTLRSVRGQTILDQFLKSALIFGAIAQRQGDLFGLATFSDKVNGFIRAANGKAHYHACRDALYMLQPERVTPDFDDLFSFIRLRLRRRSLLVVLTDLDDPMLAESFVRSAELVARQHLVVVNMIRPDGAAPLFSTPDAGTFDSLYLKLGGHLEWQSLEELRFQLNRHSISFTQVEDARLTAELVSQYLAIKERQQI